MRRLAIAIVVCLALGGCASMALSGPTDVEFLDAGYLVNNDVLATIDELGAYVADHRIREVRLVKTGGAPSTRIAEVREAFKRAGTTVSVEAK